jgi:hypothetical protein
MDLDPPAGSPISIDRKDLDPTVVIPVTASSTRYFGGVFLLFWLGGWVMGETSAITQLMSGKGRCLHHLLARRLDRRRNPRRAYSLSDISSDRARNTAAEARQHSL